MDTDDVHPFSCTHFPLALLLSICRESLVAVFPDKGRHIKLARASIVVHVSNLAEHWPFPPALVVDTTDGPHATCQVTIKANERKFTVNKITTTMLFVRECPCPVYVTRWEIRMEGKWDWMFVTYYCVFHIGFSSCPENWHRCKHLVLTLGEAQIFIGPPLPPKFFLEENALKYSPSLISSSQI